MFPVERSFFSQYYYYDIIGLKHLINMESLVCINICTKQAEIEALTSTQSKNKYQWFKVNDLSFISPLYGAGAWCDALKTTFARLMSVQHWHKSRGGSFR